MAPGGSPHSQPGDRYPHAQWGHQSQATLPLVTSFGSVAPVHTDKKRYDSHVRNRPVPTQDSQKPSQTRTPQSHIHTHTSPQSLAPSHQVPPSYTCSHCSLTPQQDPTVFLTPVPPTPTAYQENRRTPSAGLNRPRGAPRPARTGAARKAPTSAPGSRGASVPGGP